MDLVPGGARRNLTANRAAALLGQVIATDAPAVTRWQLATELVADVRQLEQRIAAVEARIKIASPRPTPACWSCSGSGRCWPPGSWGRSATFVDSPASTISPRWGQLAKGVVRPDGVVLDPPVLHQYPGFQQAGEGLHGQQPEGQGKEDRMTAWIADVLVPPPLVVGRPCSPASC
jgi:hypothetical protein